MFKQISMWKLRTDQSGDTRHKIAESIKAEFDKLPDKIHIICNLESGVNNNLSSEYYHFVLCLEFDTYEDMIIFREHKDYQKVADFMNPYIEDVKVIEYEI